MRSERIDEEIRLALSKVSLTPAITKKFVIELEKPQTDVIQTGVSRTEPADLADFFKEVGLNHTCATNPSISYHAAHGRHYFTHQNGTPPKPVTRPTGRASLLSNLVAGVGFEPTTSRL